MENYTFVGVDIAKDKFDVCLLPASKKEKKQAFSNNAKGFSDFLRG